MAMTMGQLFGRVKKLKPLLPRWAIDKDVGKYLFSKEVQKGWRLKYEAAHTWNYSDELDAEEWLNESDGLKNRLAGRYGASAVESGSALKAAIYAARDAEIIEALAEVKARLAECGIANYTIETPKNDKDACIYIRVRP